MKILVISDTHGRHGNFDKMLEREGQPDMLIHLGDVEEGEDYIRAVMECPVYMVAGNNDSWSRFAKRSRGTHCRSESNADTWTCLLCFYGNRTPGACSIVRRSTGSVLWSYSPTDRGMEQRDSGSKSRKFELSGVKVIEGRVTL